jgi:thioredoxin reductase (NADPH)
VIGGGDTAMEEALFLTRMCASVHLIHRRHEFRASKVMQRRLLENPRIVVHWNREVREVLGDDGVTGLLLRDTTGGPDETLAVTGMFLAIGHQPNSQPFEGQLPMDEAGYIKPAVGGRSHTEIPGVFVCGDVADKIYRQAVTAAGTGCMAAIDAERWLAEHE